MSRFSVGDLCIGRNFTTFCERNGMLCTITAPLAMRMGFTLLTCQREIAQAVMVRWADGLETAVEPYYLRRLRPPATALGERRIKEMFMEPEREAA